MAPATAGLTPWPQRRPPQGRHPPCLLQARLWKSLRPKPRPRRWAATSINARFVSKLGLVSVSCHQSSDKKQILWTVCQADAYKAAAFSINLMAK